MKRKRGRGSKSAKNPANPRPALLSARLRGVYRASTLFRLRVRRGPRRSALPVARSAARLALALARLYYRRVPGRSCGMALYQPRPCRSAICASRDRGFGGGGAAISAPGSRFRSIVLIAACKSACEVLRCVSACADIAAARVDWRRSAMRSIAASMTCAAVMAVGC